MCLRVDRIYYQRVKRQGQRQPNRRRWTNASTSGFDEEPISLRCVLDRLQSRSESEWYLRDVFSPLTMNSTQAVSKLNANVLHFALIPGSNQSINDLCSMIKLITDKSPNTKDLFNYRTVDNRTPLVFLASHPAFNQQNADSNAEIKGIMEKFIDSIAADPQQILLAFDMVAQRHQLKKYDHLKLLVDKSNDQMREEIACLACRYDNVKFFDWILQYINRKLDFAGFTSLFTATFYNAEECVKRLLQVPCNVFSGTIYRRSSLDKI